MAQCMATTIDNPNNPFTHPDEWLAFDKEKNYKTNELVAYFSNATTDLEEDEYNEETSLAIDRLLNFNPYGIHIKVYDYEADTLIPLMNKVYKDLVKEQKL